MRVLALADQRPPLDPALMAKRLHVDAVVLLGDPTGPFDLEARAWYARGTVPAA